MPATPLLLTIAQLAAYLDVPAAEVWRAWRAGDGPRAVERCGLPRWRTADVDAWLEAREGSRRSRYGGTVRGTELADRTAP
jgi:predicted DNA-binding transcriptional regulator AlpA